MNNNRRVRLALILTVAGVLLYLVGVVFAYLGRTAPRPADWGPWYASLITGVPNLAGLLLGSVLIVKLPRNPYGWVWVVLGLAGSVMLVGASYAIYALMVQPGTLPLGWTVATFAGLGWSVAIAMAPLVLLLFPTGKPPTCGWRIVLWVVLVALAVILCTGWAIGTGGMVPLPNPNEPSGAWIDQMRTVANTALGLIFAAIPLSAVSLLHRYRLAGQGERQQLKWFAFGSAFFVLALGSDFLYTAPGAWEPIKEALFFAVLPVTIGIAILRYRLYDINVVIRKTLVYAALTVLLAELPRVVQETLQPERVSVWLRQTGKGS